MALSGVAIPFRLKHIMGFPEADRGDFHIDGEDFTEFKESGLPEVRRSDHGLQSGALFARSRLALTWHSRCKGAWDTDEGCEDM